MRCYWDMLKSFLREIRTLKKGKILTIWDERKFKSVEELEDFIQHFSFIHVPLIEEIEDITLQNLRHNVYQFYKIYYKNRGVELDDDILALWLYLINGINEYRDVLVKHYPTAMCLKTRDMVFEDLFKVYNEMYDEYHKIFANKNNYKNEGKVVIEES